MDALRGVPLALLCLLPLVAYMSASPTGRPPLNVPVYLGLSLALLLPLLSRRSPPAVFAVVSLISFGQWLAEAQVLPANVAVLVALWSVAYRASFRWALAAMLVGELGVFLALVQWDTPTPGMFFSGSIFVVTVWLTGLYANTRRRYLESLEERARARRVRARPAGQDGGRRRARQDRQGAA